LTLQMRERFLPSSVEVVVRIHGSLLLIDMAESGHEGAQDMNSEERRSMYTMERYGLLYCDRVLAPSKALAALYISAYELDSAKVYVSPPPMDRILQHISFIPRMRKDYFLVYGKLQATKGSDLVVRAGVQFLRDPRHFRQEIVFVGYDAMCANRDYSCLKRDIPEDLLPSFKFVGGVKHEELGTYVQNARACIIASRFESFSMAAHEIYKMGVPLILSRIPAFADYFSDDSVFYFDTNSESSLRDAMVATMTQREKLVRLSNPQPIQYGNPVEEYYRVGKGSSAVAPSEEQNEIFDNVDRLSELIKKEL